MMQFQFSGQMPNASVLAAALRLLDPDVQVVQDQDQLRVEVDSTASPQDVESAFQRLGCDATLLKEKVHISGGSTCCGSCG